MESKGSGVDHKTLPSAETVRKIVSEELNKEMASMSRTGWIENLLCTTDTCDQLIGGKKKIGIAFNNFFLYRSAQLTEILYFNLQGYAQETIIQRELTIIMHSEKQLQAFQKIPPEYRMMEVDATGGLTVIYKKQREYK